MNQEQAEQCARTLTATFPRWKPTPEEAQNWAREVFARLDFDTASQAIGEYFAASRYSSPNPADYKAAYARLADRNRPAGRQDNSDCGYCGLTVVCSEPPDGRPNYAAWTVPVTFGSRSKIPHSERTQWDIAERMRQEHEAAYGGRWQIRRDAQPGQEPLPDDIDPDMPY